EATTEACGVRPLTPCQSPCRRQPPRSTAHLSATVTAGQPRRRTPCVGGGPQRIRRSDLNDQRLAAKHPPRQGQDCFGRRIRARSVGTPRDPTEERRDPPN